LLNGNGWVRRSQRPVNFLLSAANALHDRFGLNENIRGFCMRAIGTAAIGAVLAVAGVGTANAAVDYVKVCSLYGAGWFYIPGTDTCINTSSGETRVQTELGTKVDQSDLSNRVSATEGGVEETQSEIAATNAELAETNNELAKTNKQIDKQQKQIDDLEESQADLEQRFDNAFDESLDGIAIAMALAGPDLVGGERFAMKFNLGNYSGHNAFGFSASAVLARTDFGRVTVSGGVATTGQNTGGNAGVQLSW
jgi:hypothetical protein